MSVELEVEDEEEGSVRVRAEGEGEDRRVESHDGCRRGGKHTGSESVRVLFRAGPCTHSVGDWWGEQNEKRGTAVSCGTDQHGNASFFFVFFFQHVTLVHCAEPNPSPMLMPSRICLCPGHAMGKHVRDSSSPSVSLVADVLAHTPTLPPTTRLRFHPPHAYASTHHTPLLTPTPFAHYTPLLPPTRPCPTPLPALRTHARALAQCLRPMPYDTRVRPQHVRRRCRHPPAPPQCVQATSANKR